MITALKALENSLESKQGDFLEDLYNRIEKFSKKSSKTYMEVSYDPYTSITFSEAEAIASILKSKGFRSKVKSDLSEWGERHYILIAWGSEKAYWEKPWYKRL